MVISKYRLAFFGPLPPDTSEPSRNRRGVHVAPPQRPANYTKLTTPYVCTCEGVRASTLQGVGKDTQGEGVHDDAEQLAQAWGRQDVGTVGPVVPTSTQGPPPERYTRPTVARVNCSPIFDFFGLRYIYYWHLSNNTDKVLTTQ